RRDHHCRRQYRRFHAHDDDGDCAGNVERRSAARDWTRHGADRHRDFDQCVGVGRAPCRRTLRGMTMRAPASDLPIMLVEARIVAGSVTILDGISLTLSPGVPTVLIGPNGAGKTTLLRVAMGLLSPTSGRVTWGGREAAAPTHRAIMFQRPVMLRRSAAGNIRYALNAADISRTEWEQRTAVLLKLVGLGGLG